ncbi:MAG TPA: hypothetical protein GXX29_01025 [Firmicutes bacterium]|nr:hypothetical protein [Bacillota bacterium]
MLKFARSLSMWGQPAACLEGFCLALTQWPGLTGCRIYRLSADHPPVLLARAGSAGDGDGDKARCDEEERLLQLMRSAFEVTEAAGVTEATGTTEAAGTTGTAPGEALLDNVPCFYVKTPLLAGDALFIIVAAGTGVAAGSGTAAGAGQKFNQEEKTRLGEVLLLAGRLLGEALTSWEKMEMEMESSTLEQAARLRSELLSTLSHEFRTPLACIKGYVTTLLRQDVTWQDHQRLEFLQEILEESDKLEKMVTSILDMTAMDTGHAAMEKLPVLMKQLVNEVVAKMTTKLASQTGAENQKHRILVSFDPGFPIVFADPLGIEQVLFNLLDNAVKFSPGGGLITVTGRVENGMALISVADEGIGIAPTHLNRLFDKYYRINDNKKASGVGLGLPIAKNIVERHGGAIWAESVEGKGTVVTFSLPIDTSRMEMDDECQ